jgi:hypothetical protein
VREAELFKTDTNLQGKARLEIAATPFAQLGEAARSFDLMLTQFSKITLVVFAPPSVSRQR